jgi:hypothetical protein
MPYVQDYVHKEGSLALERYSYGYERLGGEVREIRGPATKPECLRHLFHSEGSLCRFMATIKQTNCMGDWRSVYVRALHVEIV